MKKLLFLVALIVATVSTTQTLSAQSVRIQNDNNNVIIYGDGENVMDIEQYERDYKFRVAGYEISIGETPQRKHTRRRNLYSHTEPLFAFGFSSLLNKDYSIYGSDEDFMDLNTGKSIEVNWSLFAATMNLTRNHRIGITTAFQLVWNNYTFAQPVSLEKVNGVLQPIDVVSSDFRKSKITTFSLRVPLMVDVALTHKFFLSAGIFGEATIKSYTKVKYPTTKSYNLPVNPFVYGFTARAGYDDFYIYADYSMTPLFKANSGPGTNVLSIGIGLGF